MNAIKEQRWRHRLSELPDQFVLDRNPSPPFDTWVSTAIGEYRLHTHHSTQVRRFSNSGGDTLVIGGIVAAEGEMITPENCPPGQYVAITDSEVFCDAGSFTRTFFDPSTTTVASSLRLLAPPGAQPVSPELLHGSRPDWYWGPRTPFREIDFLLPSQRLDLKAFAPRFRALPEPNRLSFADAAELLEKELCQSFRLLAGEGKPIRLAMTGGIDSRTLLAAAIKAEVKFETYTMISRHVHSQDVAVPQEISRRFGIRHTVLRARGVNQSERDWYLWYSAGQSVGIDADFHAAGLWHAFDAETIYVRGLGFALGRDKYRDFLQPDDWHLLETDPDEIWRRFTRPWVRPLHRYNREAFRGYAEWLFKTLSRSKIDYRDRLYLEQGSGSGCASGEHGLAATGSRRISLANGTSVYNLLLRDGPESKKTGPLQRQLIGNIDARLLDYPFIKPTPAERLRYRALDTLRALRIRQQLKRLR